MAYYELDTSEILDLLHTFGLRGKVKGNKFLTLCPYHPDTKPSLGINTRTGQFSCWSCKASGNLYNLAKDLTTKPLSSFIDTKVMESRRYLKLLKAEDFNQVRRKPMLTSDKYEIKGGRSPLSVPLVQDYLSTRDPDVRAMSDLMLKFKAFFIGSGSIRAVHKEGSEKLDFQARLFIPIHFGSDIKSYELRTVTGATPKVLYPRESDMSGLWNFSRLKPDEPLYVVEGLMDLMKLSTVFDNVTCVFGNQLTDLQKLQLRHFSIVRLIPDIDKDKSDGSNAGELLIEQVDDVVTGEFEILDFTCWKDLEPYEDTGKIPLSIIKDLITEEKFTSSSQYYFNKYVPIRKATLF